MASVMDGTFSRIIVSCIDGESIIEVNGLLENPTT